MSGFRRWSVAIVVGVSMVGVTLAQVAKKQVEVLREMFLDLDTNRDNAIEREEVPPSARSSFDRLLKRGDDNKNGKLEAEEYRALVEDLRNFTEQAKKAKAAKKPAAVKKPG